MYLCAAMEDVLILAIESSCDDTSAAVLRNTEVLSNVIAGQDIHREFGGVVPELASRAHQQNIVPVVDAALKKAGVLREQLHCIAFTRGPGLLGSLLVGTAFAKSMALGLGIPIIDVDHMRAHIMALFLDGQEKPEFPFLCLTVSGGHTQIEIVRDAFGGEIIGRTIDDAAGEAFDKAAKIMGLPYPGGPEIDKLAKQGNSSRFAFPVPSVPGLDFSYSGLKTSFLYLVRDGLAVDPEFIEKNCADLAASIQASIVGIILQRIEQAVRQTGITRIGLAGGVSANSGLRDGLSELARKEDDWKLYIPKFSYTTDNAAMIGAVAYYKYLAGQFASQETAPYSRQNR